MFRLWTNARADAILVLLIVSAVWISGSSNCFYYRLRVMRNREKIHITEVITPIGLPSTHFRCRRERPARAYTEN